ncbi:MAG TPA: transglycosylase SLT domain-containing protein [Candidatus Omnitrophota bacterium]|nr:transglycosylase SLT domain-containing protein [Candidatus Omnitrophota bacterium]
MKVSTLALIIAAGLAVVAAPQASASPAAERDLTVRVFVAAKKDRFDEAERIALAGKNRLLAKLVRWMAYTRPNSGASFAEITSFIESSPDWPLMGPLARRAEEAITAATPDEQVLAWFKTREPETVDGGMALARALLASGQGDRALKVIKKTWTEGGFGAMQERQFLTLFGEHLTDDDHWKRLDRLLWEKQDGPAQRMLMKVDAGRRVLAQARLALQDGKANPEPLVAQVPKQLRDDPGLIYDRVRWRRQKDLDEDAIDLLSHPARNQVKPELWWQERSILARRALQKGLVSRAYQTAADHGLEGNTNQVAEAEFLAGWIALRFLDDRETGLAHFQRLWDMTTTPLSRSRAAYWAGRASEAMNNKAQAREWYTRGARFLTAYYGQLSAARLDDHNWPLPKAPEPTLDDVKKFESREMVKAIRIMLDMGANEHLRAFFIRLNDVVDSPGERTLVANLAAQGGRDDLAVTVARRADRDGVFLVEQGWPVPPIAAIDSPEKALVFSLIRQESGFINDAQSPVGARGLMQLMPATAKQVAKAINLKFNPRQLDEPDVNVRLGSAYLSDLISDFEGSYILAVAGYNAGPGRARKWIREYGDPRDPNTDVIDWIEMIPFTETRNYVQRVMESVNIYRRRLGKGGQSLEADLKRWARRSAEAQ